MRRTVFTAVAAAIVALAATGCAQHQASPAASATGSASTNASGTTATASPAATPSATGSASSASSAAKAACAATQPLAARALTVTTADNGKTLCLRTGTAITVLLRGAAGDQWMPIHSGSSVLVPRADPRMMLQRWVTGAAFEAARPGVTTITSLRHPCRILTPADPGGTTSSTTTPPMHCEAIVVFRVTVAVT